MSLFRAPWAAVRMISPPCSSFSPEASLRSRSRSLSGNLRDTPTPSPSGAYTRYRPGIETSIVRRAPFVPIGSFVTCTTISWPAFSRSEMRGPPRCPRPRRFVLPSAVTISSTWRNPFFSRPMSTNAASIPASTLSTRPL